ncbi:MAG: STAS domain-containing protein [Deferribacteraceae bacterium]|jgi:anti-sigma B factor antagonist|nr:STAS domain-containing protein [Deferribacteraceae bacterium]
MKNEMKNGKQLVSLSGEINAQTGAECKAFIIKLFDTANILVLSFDKVVYLNSSGLREIIDLLKNATKVKKELRLCDMSKDIREMFTFTGLEKVFKIYDTQAAALESK